MRRVALTMAFLGIVACSRNTSSPAGQAAGTGEPGAEDSAPKVAPGSIEIAGTSCTDRTANVAFSPGGRWLAHVDGSALVIRSVTERVAETARMQLGGLRLVGMAFGGDDALGVIAVDDIGLGRLISFVGPDWKQGQMIELVGMAPRVVVGHPSIAQVLVAPRPAIEWGRDQAQERSRSQGFAAYDLRSGEVTGGAGPLGSTAEQLTLSWTDDAPMSMWLDTLVRWSLSEGTRQARIDVADGPGICHVITRGTGDPFLGWASPPRVGVPGAAPVALDDLGDLLYQVVAQADGSMVAIVLDQKAGHVERVTAQVLAGGQRRARWPLGWPLAGAAIHPTLQLLAWIEGAPGSGTLRLMRLTDGAALRPDEPLGRPR